MAENKTCVFCDKTFLKKQKLFDNLFFNVCFDGFPLNEGHLLIIPKRCVKSVFDLTLFEYICLFFTVRKVKKYLDKTYSPDGFNIGINVNEAGGQTVQHVHIHVIPRYENDGGLPCGVRNIFPSKANYVNNNNRNVV